MDQIQLIDLDPKVRLTYRLAVPTIFNPFLRCRTVQSSKHNPLTMSSPALGSITASNVQSVYSPSFVFAFQSLNETILDVRHYETDAALQSHWRSKVHKRRCKALKEPAYTIEESERAAGLGKDNGRPSASVMETS